MIIMTMIVIMIIQIMMVTLIKIIKTHKNVHHKVGKSVHGGIQSFGQIIEFLGQFLGTRSVAVESGVLVGFDDSGKRTLKSF